MNMMRAPPIEPPTSNVMLIISLRSDFSFLGSLMVVGCPSSQLRRSMIWKPKKPSTKVMISRIPLSTTQSMMRQLQPRLKLVLTISLPSPTAMTNHMRKLKTFMKLMSHLALRRETSSSSQWMRNRTSRTLMLIQTRRLRMLASTKNSSKRKQQRVRMRVCAMASMQMRLSSLEMGLLFSCVSTRQPLMKMTSMTRLMIPSKTRRVQVKPSSVHWKMVEQEAAGCRLLASGFISIQIITLGQSNQEVEFFSISKTLPMLAMLSWAAMRDFRCLYITRMFSVGVNSMISRLNVFDIIEMSSMLLAYLLKYPNPYMQVSRNCFIRFATFSYFSRSFFPSVWQYPRIRKVDLSNSAASFSIDAEHRSCRVFSIFYRLGTISCTILDQA